MGTVQGMSSSSGLTEEQWDLCEPVFNAPGRRGRDHSGDLPIVVDAMLYLAQASSQWLHLPTPFGPRTASALTAGRCA